MTLTTYVDHSMHFSRTELADRLTGECRMHPGALWCLEMLRWKTGGHPITIISGFRSPSTNRRVGGAEYSQHQYGLAFDIFPHFPLKVVRALDLFSGIGYRDGTVRHVDCRELVPETNRTHSTRFQPALWDYGAS